MSQAATGTIVQTIGAVIDIEFPRDAMPRVYDALVLEDSGNALAEKGLTFEVEQQLGDGVVRTIALGSSDGLQRGMKVRNTGAADLGAGRPGRARSRDGRARSPDRRAWPDPVRRASRDPPVGAEVRRARAVGRAARDRHQGHRPDLPVREGRQDRPVRRRRRRQDRQHARADQQHRQGALGPVGVRRRRRAHARRQRLLSRDVGRQGHRAGRPEPVEGGDGVRPDERAAGQPPARRAHGPHDGRALPRRRPRHPVLRRQHLPLHARRHRSVRAARPHAVGRGLPADARRGNGPPAGAHHVDQDRLDHVDPGRVRPRGRPDRPVAGDDLRPPRRHASSCRATSPRSASTRPWTRSTRRRARSTRT